MEMDNSNGQFQRAIAMGNPNGQCPWAVPMPMGKRIPATQWFENWEISIYTVRAGIQGVRYAYEFVAFGDRMAPKHRFWSHHVAKCYKFIGITDALDAGPNGVYGYSAGPQYGHL